MEIRTDYLQVEIKKLQQLIESYDHLYLNLYNQLLSASFFWQSEKAAGFFENIEKEKLSVKLAMDELVALQNIYSYLLEKYQKLGQRIGCQLNSKDMILARFDRCLDQISQVIDEYHQLSVSFCPQEASYLYKQQTRLYHAKEKLKEIRQRVKATFEAIEIIEQTVKSKISQLEIEKMKEMDIVPFV